MFNKNSSGKIFIELSGIREREGFFFIQFLKFMNDKFY